MSSARGNQVGLELLLAHGEVGLLLRLLFLVLDDEPGLGGLAPAVADEHIDIVLHRLGPVVHEVLVNVVGIEQPGFAEGLQQLFRERFDERLGLAADGDAFQPRRVGLPPLRKQRGDGVIEGGELRVAKDGGLSPATATLSWL